MSNIIGREEEISILDNMYLSDKPEFLAVYGRRRVGKTYLIRQFFTKKKSIFFNVTGSKNGTIKEQLAHFSKQIGKVFYGGLSPQPPKSWDEAFEILIQAIEKQPQKTKIILFFDEIPWLATRRSRLLEALDYYWNQYWSEDPRIKLIICGSSASWIIRKVIQNKGGLHNRITRKIRLEPFTLSETKKYLKSLGVTLTNQHILMIYMVTGGVPYYLSNVKAGQSAAEIIEELAFRGSSILLDEFDLLFSSLFDNAEQYVEIIRTIAAKRYGIGKRELLKSLGAAGLGASGLKKLEDLEETGFIMSFMPYQHKRQGIYYRVIDEYILFYLKWIEPMRKSVQRKALDQGSWKVIQQTPGWQSWSGYAFEAVCYKHISGIRKALALGPDAIADAWRYVPRSESEIRGAQIDLLFDRNDDVITLCEIKMTDSVFVLTKAYFEILQRKQDVFRAQTGTKKQLFMVMISANGVKVNKYSKAMLSGVVTLDDLFKY